VVKFTYSPDGIQQITVDVTLEECAKNLKRFAKFIKEVTSIQLNEKIKQAINRALIDVHDSYNWMCEVIDPFDDIAKARFKKDFELQYKKFNRNYNKYSKKPWSCFSVEVMLKKLSEDNSWKTKLPGAQKKLSEMKELYNIWHVNDNLAYQVMDIFFKELKSGLKDIYQNLDDRKSSESYRKLHLVLDKVLPKNQEIQPIVKELERIRVNL
jgi:hypothetical protein